MEETRLVYCIRFPNNAIHSDCLESNSPVSLQNQQQDEKIPNYEDLYK